MTEEIYIPQGRLAHHVQFFWYSDGHSSSAEKERVLPSGTSQLIINLGDHDFRHFKGLGDCVQTDGPAIISGIKSKYLFLDPNTRTSTMGAVFRVGGIQALFDLPANEFLNHTVALSNVTGLDIPGIRERLSNAGDPKAKFKILESMLLQLMNPDFQLNPALISVVRQFQTQGASQSISDIARTIGYSRRQLSTLFREAVGVAPKTYGRIRRFQQAIKIIRRQSRPKWSRIALSCGYYDQAHFNRDFKALSGLTPTEYHKHKTRETNHLSV